MTLSEAESVQVFEIAKAGSSGVAVLTLLLPIVILLGVIWFAWPRSLKVEVSPEALSLRGSLYGRVIPRSQLVVERLRAVDLSDDSPYKLARRTNGIGLPSYSVGWFRTRAGEKALAFVTGRQNVAYLPTTDGYVLLLSVADYERFASALGAPR